MYELSNYTKTLNTYFRFFPIESEIEYRKNILYFGILEIIHFGFSVVFFYARVIYGIFVHKKYIKEY